MSNDRETLYIGMTNNLERRVFEHKQNLVPGFTARYGLHKLLYYSEFASANEGWKRSKKLALIFDTNPHFRDLSE